MARTIDLRTGRPVWTAYRAPRVPVRSLRKDLKTDVLIVGRGISGAMMAEALTADGHAVVAIDRRGPMLGSTAATTALVQFEVDQPLGALAHQIGTEAAGDAWRRSRLAVLNLRARIAELGLRCDLSSRRTLYLAGNVLTGGALRAEADAAARRVSRSPTSRPVTYENCVGGRWSMAALNVRPVPTGSRRVVEPAGR